MNIDKGIPITLFLIFVLVVLVVKYYLLTQEYMRQLEEAKLDDLATDVILSVEFAMLNGVNKLHDDVDRVIVFLSNHIYGSVGDKRHDELHQLAITKAAEVCAVRSELYQDIDLSMFLRDLGTNIKQVDLANRRII